MRCEPRGPDDYYSLTVVHVFPAMKTSWVRRRNRKGILVYGPTKTRYDAHRKKSMLYLYTTNTEFNECTKHLATRNLIRGPANSAFDQ